MRLSQNKENVKLSVVFSLEPHELTCLAYSSDLLREDPTKAWSVSEAKEHARATIQRLVLEHIASKEI